MALEVCRQIAFQNSHYNKGAGSIFMQTPVMCFS